MDFVRASYEWKYPRQLFLRDSLARSLVSDSGNDHESAPMKNYFSIDAPGPSGNLRPRRPRSLLCSNAARP
eukprot:scaffold41708_cov18-Prasinocladus_malaysianus.AAC.1